MSTYIGSVKTSGELKTKKIAAPKPPLSWRLRQWTRKDHITGLIGHGLANLLSKTTGIITLQGTLRAVLIRADTTAFAELMVDQLQTETSVWGDFKFHDSGVGVTGAAITDTDIETTDGEARATGTQTENGSKVYQSVGTITYTTTKAITEHGLFNAASGVTLLDRHTFTAINVENTDSIQFTFDFTVADGG
jgi:hypothetical protein